MNFLLTQCLAERGSRAKTSSIHSAFSTEHLLVTDTDTYRHKAIASTRTSIASRG